MGRVAAKVCIITGSNRGIGYAIGLRLLSEGAKVVFADVSEEIHQTVANIGDDENTLSFQVDVSERSQVKALINATIEKFKTIDVMFNNAGINKPLDFLDITEDNWNLIMKINGLGVLIGTQEAAKAMIALQKPGKIINTASIAGRQGFDNVAPYCASKFATVSLIQSAARALASHKITVNGFAPGVVNTELWKQLDLDLMAIGASERPGQAMAEFSADILMGRPASPDDITGTALFLASADSDYMTGQVIMIDGGMVLV